ncbi:MAG: Gfo/Idh/MocA family oxidoreductase [Abditibacteriaceae bacterium]
MESNTKIKVVQVGCGNMSSAWLEPALQMPQLEYVGLVDISRANAEEKAERFGLSKEIIFNSLAEALEKANPDVVFDVTVPSAHYDVTMQALRHGCHVLGEKPMSDSMEKAREMVRAARQSGKIYAVIQNRRYEPNILRSRDLLASGAIGRVHTVHSDFFLAPHFGGFRDAMEQPLLIDMAIHTFDAARCLGKLDPVAVYCKSFNPYGSWYEGDASAIAIFDMVDAEGNPVVFCYRGSWCAEGFPTSWNSSWRVIGLKGTLIWSGEEEIQTQAVDTNAQATDPMPIVNIEAPAKQLEYMHHAALIHEFIDCVQSGELPQTYCEDNIKSLAMVLGAVESARSGQRVDISAL